MADTFGKFSDHEIHLLVEQGKREAELFDELDGAVAAGDHELVWQIAKALCGRSEDPNHRSK
jgi:hypothetical protein